MSTNSDRLFQLTSTAGLISWGIIYLLMGAFAIAAGFTSADKKDSKGVIQFVAEQPFGQIMLVILIIGVLCYFVWRFVQAVYDTEEEGNDLKGWTYRMAYLGSGLIFLAIGFIAVKALLGDSSSGGNERAESWSAMILSLPFGRWILGAAFLLVLVIGLYQGYTGISLSFLKRVDLNSLSKASKNFIVATAVFGHVVRSILILLVSVYLFQAAWFLDPDEAKGLGGALNTVHGQPFGRWLLALAGVGLVCCGIFAFARSRLDPSGEPDQSSTPGH